MACIHPIKSHKMHIFWFACIGKNKSSSEDATTKLTMATHSVVSFTSHYIAHWGKKASCQELIKLYVYISIIFYFITCYEANCWGGWSI